MEPIAPGAQQLIRERLGIGTPMIALFVGSLDRRKDPLTAAIATARLIGSSARAGAPGRRRRSTQLDAGAGCRQHTNVRLLGHRSDVSDFMAIADIFVLPSEREGLSYALLEAMANGRERVRGRFSLEAMQQGTHRVYLSVARAP